MKKVVDLSPASYELRALFRGSFLSYLVGIYIFAFYLELHTRISFLSAIRFQFVFGAFLSAVCVFKFFSDKSKNSLGKMSSVTNTVFLLIFIMGLYTIFAMDKTEASRVYSDRVLKFALVSFFIYVGVDKIEDLRVILALMLLAWLKLGQEGLVGWLTGSMVWENQGIPRLRGSTAMFAHPNSYSGFAVGCIPFCAFLFPSVKSKFLKVGLLALLLCSLIIIVSTGSRTGYVAIIIAVGYFFIKIEKGKLKILLAAIPILLIGLNYIPDDYKDRFSSIFTGEEKEGSSSDTRLQIIEDAFSLYAQYPLGVGVSSFRKVRGELFDRYQDTHNLYLEVLTNIGPLGFIVFIVFVVRLIKLNGSNIRALKSESNINLHDLDRTLLVGLGYALTGYIIIRLVLGVFGMDLYEIYWWIALGYGLAIKKLILLNSSRSISS
jgi:putative inorganic carbon (HCO3(-)) transporter